MRRRFGRGRKSKGAGESKKAPIDAARAFGGIVEAGLVEVDALEPVAEDGIAATFAAVGIGERDGRTTLAAFAPRNAGDAALAGVAVAQRFAAENGFTGELVVAAPQWSSASRRRLAVLAVDGLPFTLKAVSIASLAEDDDTIDPEPAMPCFGVSVRQVAAGLGRATDRELFLRAAAALEGLAAKHGGAIRGVGARLELVLLARRTAALHAGADTVELEMLLDDRSTTRLSAEGLATAMDQLEGAIRKRLNDRRARGGEEGLRAQLTPALAEIAGVRDAQRWPIGGSDADVIDFVGVHDDGRPVVGAVRNEFTLAALADLLDAALAAQPLFPSLLADVPPPLRFGPPRLLIAAKEFSGPALRVLAALALDHVSFDVQARRGRDPVLALREGVALPETSSRASDAIVATTTSSATASSATASFATDSDEAGEARPAVAGRKRSRGRGRRGGRRPRGGEEATGENGDEAPERMETSAVSDAGDAGDAGDAVGAASFDEVSLFDLAEDDRGAAEGDENGGRRSRRGRGRGRRRRGGRGGEGAERDDAGAAPEASAADDGPDAGGGEEAEGSGDSARRGRRRGRREPAKSDEDDVDDVDDLSQTLAPLDEVSELDELIQPAYEEDDEEDGEMVRRRRDAEQRARDAGIDPPSPEQDEKLSLPRKRAAIVVHADRASLICGLLLARDLRQIEGFWVYGQNDLMTFFRGVATDLGDSTPIYVVGFNASPARETLQAASLYRGRLAWFDHREWPPEDLGEMRDILGAENVHVTPGAESCLSDVLSLRTRRSRFSDKIVELATGRFTQHDYERWGRLWWHRLGEAARRSGERRADIDALLTGRPSDLANEAERIPTPDAPPEVGYVSERDFRLVHFHGFTLVVVPTPPELDLHLTARIARERYEAEVSVALTEGGDLVVLGADGSRSRHGIDLAGMLDHLASKHDWVIPLPGEDHVARLRIRDLPDHPDRFDELISEIAMGRSILEG